MPSLKQIRDLKLTAHGNYELGQIIDLVVKEVMPVMKNYVGQKITIADGSTTKKLATDLNLRALMEKFKPLPFTTPGFASFQTLYLSQSYNAAYLTFKICLNGGSYDDKTQYCQYFERRIYIGRTTDDGKLFDLENLDTITPPVRVDVDAELIKVEAWKKLQAIADRAKGEINLDYTKLEYL